MNKGILWVRTRLEVTCKPNRFLIADIRKFADDGKSGIDFNITVSSRTTAFSNAASTILPT